MGNYLLIYVLCYTREITKSDPFFHYDTTLSFSYLATVNPLLHMVRGMKNINECQKKFIRYTPEMEKRLKKTSSSQRLLGHERISTCRFNLEVGVIVSNSDLVAKKYQDNGYMVVQIYYLSNSTEAYL